jgi:hypothetical protein
MSAPSYDPSDSGNNEKSFTPDIGPAAGSPPEEVPPVVPANPTAPDPQLQQQASTSSSSAEDNTTSAIEAARAKALESAASALPKVNDEELGDAILRARKSPADVAVLVTAKKHHVSIPIAKPSGTGKYLRAREGDEWSPAANAFLMFDPRRSEQKEYLMVHPDLEEFVRSKKQLAAAMRTIGLAFMVDASGSPSYWPLNLQDTGDWGTSARLAVEDMQTNWGMVVNDGDHWAVEHPEDDLGDPTWPPGSADEWLLKAFRERIVDTVDHPVIKKLLGKK